MASAEVQIKAARECRGRFRPVCGRGVMMSSNNAGNGWGIDLARAGFMKGTENMQVHVYGVKLPLLTSPIG